MACAWACVHDRLRARTQLRPGWRWHVERSELRVSLQIAHSVCGFCFAVIVGTESVRALPLVRQFLTLSQSPAGDEFARPHVFDVRAGLCVCLSV